MLYMDGFILMIKMFARHCFSSSYWRIVIHVHEFRFSCVPYLWNEKINWSRSIWIIQNEQCPFPTEPPLLSLPPFLVVGTVNMCPSLSSFSLDHGKWRIVNGSHYEYGTKIIFTCNPGYHRVGPSHIQCLAHGAWSWRNERPRCRSEKPLLSFVYKH